MLVLLILAWRNMLKRRNLLAASSLLSGGLISIVALCTYLPNIVDEHIPNIAIAFKMLILKAPSVARK